MLLLFLLLSLFVAVVWSLLRPFLTFDTAKLCCFLAASKKSHVFRPDLLRQTPDLATNQVHPLKICRVKGITTIKNPRTAKQFGD